MDNENCGLASDLEQMASAYFTGNNLALLFDFDGTLAPLVTHPDLATCPDSVQQLLASLALLPRVTVGIISARALADLKSKICLPKLAYAGSCGLEFELEGRVVLNTRAGQCAPLMQAVAELAASTVSAFSGAWIERKPFTFTVHYRQVSRDEVPFLTHSLAKALCRFEDTLISCEGSMATEIFPNIGWTKGNALDFIVRQNGRETIPLYAGNDANDACAFKAAHTYGGISIGVGPRAPASAEFALPDISSLAECLGKLLTLLGSSDPSVGGGIRASN